MDLVRTVIMEHFTRRESMDEEVVGFGLEGLEALTICPRRALGEVGLGHLRGDGVALSHCEREIVDLGLCGERYGSGEPLYLQQERSIHGGLWRQDD